jgi:hypothetical protein
MGLDDLLIIFEVSCGIFSFFFFSPAGFGYVRPPSIRSRADYCVHTALKEIEGGCRGKSLLNLIQDYLPYFPICLESGRPCHAEAVRTP